MFRLCVFLGRKKKKKLRFWKATVRSACGSPLLFPHFGKQRLIHRTSWAFVGSLHDKITSDFVGSFYVEKHLKYVRVVINHGTVWVGRDLKAHLIPSLLWTVTLPPDLAAPNPVQPF